jgi:hypothetical protein
VFDKLIDVFALVRSTQGVKHVLKTTQPAGDAKFRATTKQDNRKQGNKITESKNTSKQFNNAAQVLSFVAAGECRMVEVEIRGKPRGGGGRRVGDGALWA